MAVSQTVPIAEPGSALARGAQISQSVWALESSLSDATNQLAWHHLSFPGKAVNLHKGEQWQGRAALRVDSIKAVSMLRHGVNVDPTDLGALRFSWHVPMLLPNSDIGSADFDDSPVRIVLAFEGDRSRFSGKNSMMNELSRVLMGEEMPYATLVYTWCGDRQVGSVVHSPRTDRIRAIVVESGNRRLNQWIDYRRDIASDFHLAFGEAPGRLVGVAVMSDTDNTQHASTTWYGPIRFAPK